MGLIFKRSRPAITRQLAVAPTGEFSHNGRGALRRDGADEFVLGAALAETVASIVAAHRTGAATPEETVARTFARIRDPGDGAIFISLREEAEAGAAPGALAAAGGKGKPLYGVPVAVKDNIDV